MQKGLVSVIIPTFKRAENLKSAINSILCQTYQNFEIIVVDDNNDNDEFRKATSKVMLEFENNSKVKYLKHHVNQNGSAARNTGILECQGEYIAFLDDDDLSLPERISKSVRALEESGNDIGAVCVGFVKRYHNYIYKKGNGCGVYSDCYGIISKNLDLSPGSTIMYKRSSIEKIGLYDVSYKKHQDWEYLIRLFRNFNVLAIEDVEVIIRAGIFGGRPNIEVVKEMKKKLFEEFDDDISKLPAEKVEIIKKNQWLDIYLGYLKEKSFKKAQKFKQEYKAVLKFNCKDTIKMMQAIIEGFFPKSILVIYALLNIRYSSLAKFRNINY